MLPVIHCALPVHSYPYYNKQVTLDATHYLRLTPGRDYKLDFRMDYWGDSHVVFYGNSMRSNLVVEDMPVPNAKPPKSLPTGCEGILRNLLVYVSVSVSVSRIGFLCFLFGLSYPSASARTLLFSSGILISAFRCLYSLLLD